jgi:phage-related protein
MGRREKILAWAEGAELSADDGEWRVFYHVAADVVLVLGVFHKKTQKTPPRWIETCRKRLRLFNES